MTQMLRKLYWDNALTIHQCQSWFAKFQSDNFDVNDTHRLGRKLNSDDDEIKAMVQSNPRFTTREIAEPLHTAQSIVDDFFRSPNSQESLKFDFFMS